MIYDIAGWRDKKGTTMLSETDAACTSAIGSGSEISVNQLPFLYNRIDRTFFKQPSAWSLWLCELRRGIAVLDLAILQTADCLKSSAMWTASRNSRVRSRFKQDLRLDLQTYYIRSSNVLDLRSSNIYTCVSTTYTSGTQALMLTYIQNDLSNLTSIYHPM